MMTSRAEHRLVLREDNTIDRLAAIAIATGLVSGQVSEKYELELGYRTGLTSKLQSAQIVPNEKTQEILRSKNTPVLLKPISLADLLRRSEISRSDMTAFGFGDEEVASESFEAVEIGIKYSGYIERQNEIIRQMRDLERMVIPKDFSFANVRGLSKEETEKLSNVRPWSLGQAQRISGINPSAIQAILFYLRANERGKRQSTKTAENRRGLRKVRSFGASASGSLNFLLMLSKSSDYFKKILFILTGE